MFDSESRIWSRTGPKVHIFVPREIIRGKHFRERRWVLDSIIPQLREIWADLISKSTRKDGKLSLNAFTWLNKVTLDIIGLAGEPTHCSIHLREVLISHSVPKTGFDYSFNSLHSPDEKQNELYESIRSIFTIQSSGFMFILQMFFPLFRPIVGFYSFRKSMCHKSSSLANFPHACSQKRVRSHTTHRFSTYSREESRCARRTQLGWLWRHRKA